jgi:cytochrome c-type biogenesis protein CcmH
VRARVLCALLVALAVAPAALASESRPTQADLEDEVICPTCQTTVDQSDAPIARRIKQFIAARIAAGDSKREIKDALVAQFGPRVLASPPKRGFSLLAWLLPPLGLVAAAGVVGLLAWRWSRRRGPDEEAGAREPDDAPLDAELERRLDEELARFEA